MSKRLKAHWGSPQEVAPDYYCRRCDRCSFQCFWGNVNLSILVQNPDNPDRSIEGLCPRCGPTFTYMGFKKPPQVEGPTTNKEWTDCINFKIAMADIKHDLPLYNWPIRLTWNLFVAAAYSYGQVNSMGKWWDYMSVYTDKWQETYGH